MNTNKGSVAFVFDRSQSMTINGPDLLAQLVESLNAYRVKIACPDVDAYIYYFSNTVDDPIVRPLSTPFETWSCTGSTALYDAVYRALETPNLRSIVAITDGAENSSRCVRAELRTRLDSFKEAGGVLILFGPRNKSLLDKYVTVDERLTFEQSQDLANIVQHLSQTIGSSDSSRCVFDSLTH